MPINLLFIFSNFAVNQLAYKRLQSLCNELDKDDILVSAVEQSLIVDFIVCDVCMVRITFSCYGSQVFSLIQYQNQRSTLKYYAVLQKCFWIIKISCILKNPPVFQQSHMWTCLEQSLRLHWQLMKDRHLDQVRLVHVRYVPTLPHGKLSSMVRTPTDM